MDPFYIIIRKSYEKRFKCKLETFTKPGLIKLVSDNLQTNAFTC